ncbi:hypothetical protein [Kitasatospora purpeofusca]|uniref:hypothetical protein n=1 Tax=Kitasatospora purpeofusca TaxID=67352 RepID=UPI0038659495|nr:hypothetical protein OIP63_31935 [Kitasatospora purpeofusca]
MDTLPNGPGPDGDGPGHLPVPPVPLVRVDGRWLLGDHRDRTHLEFAPEGIVPHADGRAGEVLPWARFMSLGLSVTTHRWMGSRRTALLSLGQMAPLGLTGPHLAATVRHPYTYWTGRFSHHRGVQYAPRGLVALGVLLAFTVDAGEAALLGDRAWMDEAVPAVLALRREDEARAAVTKLVAGARAARGLREP